MCWRWSVFNVPKERRLQTLAVIAGTWPTSLMVSLTLMCLLIYLGGWYRIAMLVYLGFIFTIDRRTPEFEGRYYPCLRRMKKWRYFADYFPAQLVKTVDIPAAEGPYIFGYHPHGILSVGAVANFLTEATGFSEKFPGIELRALTLKSNLIVPFHREYAMGHGAGVASRDGIVYHLGKGRSVLIVLGGAAEVLDARPNEFNLVLQKRKGFIKIALQTGANLVPVITFGENDLFIQLGKEDDSTFRRIQNWIKNKLGFPIPIFYGRGIFNYDFGLLPHLGEPIPVEQVESPTSEQIEELHNKYCQAVQDLFDTHKVKYAEDPKVQLRFVA